MMRIKMVIDKKDNTNAWYGWRWQQANYV